MNLSSLSKVKIAAFLAMGTAILSTLIGFLGGSAMQAISLLFLLGTLGSLTATLYFQRKLEKEIKRTKIVCKSLARGNFETRLTNIVEGGDFGEFQWALNEMTDTTDAFVREATAAMEYVSRNQYFRRILEDGMQGDLLSGARIINRATESVGAKMNGFVVIANDFDGSLKEVVKDINTTVSSLSKTANSMEETVALTREGADAAVSSSDETSVNVQAISAAAEEMSSCISEISQQVTRTSDIAQSAVQEAEESGRTVQELSQNAEKIGDVVQIIDKIAEQTNLLALNATIEAARAGDAGKGFAVVASEVKDLAGQTAAATEEISEQITGIQAATEKAIESFSGIGKTIGEINEAATAVAAAIEQQSAASQEIASGAGRAAAGTDYVAGNVKEINQGIAQVDEAAKQVLSVTGELSEHATKKVEALLGKMGVFMTELKKIT